MSLTRGACENPYGQVMHRRRDGGSERHTGEDPGGCRGTQQADRNVGDRGDTHRTSDPVMVRDQMPSLDDTGKVLKHQGETKRPGDSPAATDP